MPKQQLSDIELDEVTVCEEPANEDSVVVIVKANPKPHDEPLKEADMPDIDDELDDELLVEGEDGDDAEIELSDEDAQALAEEIEALNEAGELIPAFALMAANLEEAGEVITKQQAALEEREAEFAELKKMSSLLLERVEKMRAGETVDEDDLVAVIKSLNGGALSPEAERRIAALELVQKQAEEKDLIAKAKDLGVTGIKAEELAPILYRIRKGRTTSEDADRIEKLLAHQATALKKSGAFNAIGSSAVDAGTAEAKIAAAAEDLRKSKPTLSKEQAADLVLQENPALYDEYMAERRTRAA